MKGVTFVIALLLVVASWDAFLDACGSAMRETPGGDRLSSSGAPLAD
jgi:hypothetical protein